MTSHLISPKLFKNVAKTSSLPDDIKLSRELVKYLNGGRAPACHYYHPDCSHFMRQIKKVVHMIKALWKVYIPIHVIPTLLFRFQNLKKQYSFIISVNLIYF